MTDKTFTKKHLRAFAEDYTSVFKHPDARLLAEALLLALDVVDTAFTVRYAGGGPANALEEQLDDALGAFRSAYPGE